MSPAHSPVLLRRFALITVDGLLIAFSFWLAFALRFGELNPPQFLGNLWLLSWSVGLGLAILVLSGWYRSLTRFSGSHSLYGLLPRSGLAVLLLLLVFTLTGPGEHPPRSFWVLFWILLSANLIASRIGMRDLLRLSLAGQASATLLKQGPGRNQRQPTLVYGAGQAAAQLLADLRYQSPYKLVGVLDDDPALWGRSLEGLPIHSPDQLSQLIERHGIQKMLLAIPSAPRRRRRELVDQCTAIGLTVLTIPSLSRIAAGEEVVTDLRPVAIEDLLGRETSQPDPALMEAAVAGKVVLVSGAGGSIGSELCRQILNLGPRCLLLLERSELALYELEQELSSLRQLVSHPLPGLVPVLGDVGDRRRLAKLCHDRGVQVLFHAAAYKHVPLVEANPCAGVANNVYGTRAALEVAFSCGLERFVLISTDKAVRPTNVMGASKRVCELLVQAAAARTAAAGNGPICSMVRFGNVLGSSGSVVPHFRREIAAGGPLTVTHPQITRYFMTIPEAVELVLQSSGMARGGEVFVLDMGEPVRILDLARQMIRLSGFTIRDDAYPDGEIGITFTGLRPGEKLYEELLIQESDQPTDHPLIRKANEEFLAPEQLEPLVEELQHVLEEWDDQRLIPALRALVRDYQPLSGPVSGSRTISHHPAGEHGIAPIPSE
ncbi:MAG: nucleoside-diphosphate sugar epimerase/dehydratase [Cyanobium sp. CZS 48M]|nr:nucleoside-diphosphate sugar epimerase/dehydratase [Cyanobium sp. CZS48M]